MDAAELLTDLVSIPSLSGEEREASQFLADWLGQHGYEADVDAVGNAIGVRGAGEHEILLLGHIDTVPGQLPVERIGNWLTGRGVVDAKGPLCAFACAAGNLDVPENWRITVVGAVEEESATSRGARFILKQREKPPVCCIIGEPSSWDRVTLGYRGRLLMDVDLRAPMAHSAGNSKLPAERAVDIWRAVENECEKINRELGAKRVFDTIDASLRSIKTRCEGSSGFADLTVGLRLPPDVGPDEVAARMIGVVRKSFEQRPEKSQKRERKHAQLNSADPPQIGCRFYGKEQAYRGSKANALVRAFLRSIRKADGKPRFVLKSGTSDMNVLGTQWPELPMVAYGPGDSALDHTPEEALDLRELKRSVEVLENALVEIVRKPPEAVAGR